METRSMCSDNKKDRRELKRVGGGEREGVAAYVLAVMLKWTDEKDGKEEEGEETDRRTKIDRKEEGEEGQARAGTARKTEEGGLDTHVLALISQWTDEKKGGGRKRSRQEKGRRKKRKDRRGE
ncbi:hypothetical protein EAG_08189 [Camponotus floridanus]|uniref:Uncharacterized protein n=1 Tax=Camponotus floridanus TaxID=104421 RepID=E2AXU9_CAMFO|nr:hypothetical protein EAG_08189 [Camponotus floridanus]